jgi:hypothetical protein
VQRRRAAELSDAALAGEIAALQARQLHEPLSDGAAFYLARCLEEHERRMQLAPPPPQLAEIKARILFPATPDGLAAAKLSSRAKAIAYLAQLIEKQGGRPTPAQLDFLQRIKAWPLPE